MHEKDKLAVRRNHKKNLINSILNIGKKKKMKQSDVFETLPKGTHLMSDNKTIMSGLNHNKNSKVIGKLGKKKSVKNRYSITGRGRKKY